MSMAPMKSAPPSHDGAEMIRVPLTALLAAARFATIDHIPASAQTGISQYPFCMQGMDNPGWSGCSFNTMATCQATASGTDAECLTNPWYRPGPTLLILLLRGQRAWVDRFRLGRHRDDENIQPLIAMADLPMKSNVFAVASVSLLLTPGAAPAECQCLPMACGGNIFSSNNCSLTKVLIRKISRVEKAEIA